ncbi:MAG: penicillin-binding protein 2 [Candidatus Shapirobacteria bacterium]|nr:penicillin-binding protein 2 [Candidatus Shapirobacteria bacterium]
MAQNRIRILGLIIGGFFIIILLRLFWWQVVNRDQLLAQAENQHWQENLIPAKRGGIFYQDGYPLALDQPTFNLHAFKPELKITSEELVDHLEPIIFEDNQKSEKKRVADLLASELLWVPISKRVNQEKKAIIEKLNINGLQLSEEFSRHYPQKDLAAHLLGFVGKNTRGENTGYLGLEGFYHDILKGKDGFVIQEKDAFGKPIVLGEPKRTEPQDGADLKLFLDRKIQWAAEKHLKRGVEQYGALGGVAIVADPKTGGILAMASYPNFDPNQYATTDQELFNNPAISRIFEPGSIFKVITMAAALEENTITPETVCPICDGPIKIGEHEIKTWNNEYRPNSNMREILERSDNVGLVFVGQTLGRKKFLDYLNKFGFGQKTNIDLQAEATGSVKSPNLWYDFELATATFGQGFGVTPIQMIQAVSVLANGGYLIQPRVVAEINGQPTISLEKIEKKPVISPKTARTITDMMVGVVKNSTIPWTDGQIQVAGKTGTAQIFINGQYDPNKTIGSFVGFAPARDPEFVMLVVIFEPSASVWGSRTAAPIWFDIAEDIFLIKSINPRN